MRAPNASLLAARDPATMAVLGLVASNFGSQFAGEFGADFGDDYGDDYGDDTGIDFGDDVAAAIGAEFGDEVGAAVAARVRKRPARSAVNPAALAAWNKQRAMQAKSQRRASLLEPNKGSAVKVERYSFPISQALTIGTGVALVLQGSPDVNIRPQRVTMNSPCQMFAFVAEIKVANVSVTVGGGFEDAYDYNANGVGQSLDMPTLSPANRASVLGSYTGFVPPGMVIGFPTFFTVSFKGPASVIA
jgi:hypothetical protein